VLLAEALPAESSIHPLTSRRAKFEHETAVDQRTCIIYHSINVRMNIEL